MNAVIRGPKNKIFNLWRCLYKRDIETKKMEGKPQKRLQDVNADEKGLLIEAVDHYCGIDRANPQNS